MLPIYVVFIIIITAATTTIKILALIILLLLPLAWITHAKILLNSNILIIFKMVAQGTLHFFQRTSLIQICLIQIILLFFRWKIKPIVFFQVNLFLPNIHLTIDLLQVFWGCMQHLEILVGNKNVLAQENISYRVARKPYQIILTIIFSITFGWLLIRFFLLKLIIRF